MAVQERDDDGLMLPPLDDRRWLQDQLKALVAARGVAPLATALLVEPSARYFPDPWGGGEPSVRRLLSRVCAYAGMAGLRVAVRIYDAEPSRRGEVVGKPPVRNGQELAVWLAKVSPAPGGRPDHGEIEVGVESSALVDPASLVAACARVISHAYRVVHGLATTDAYDPRIDVTAVYLGFGMLTADAALRFVTRTSTGVMQTRRTPLRLGSLPPQGVCFLLAAQIHVRGEGRAERQRLAKNLQANQAAFFRHAFAAIERMDPPIAVQLGVPARDHWPTPPSLAELTAPLPDAGSSEPETRLDEDRGVAGMNRGKPVFMVDRSMAPRLGRVLFMGALMLGGVLSRMSPGSGGGMSNIAVIAAGLGLAGLGIGRLFRDRRCSEPKCGAPLRPALLVCPRCSGNIVGTIGHPKERLAAEEAHLKALSATPAESLTDGTAPVAVPAAPDTNTPPA
ncbi:MAG TPA: hypothetical protein VGB85_12520 [Nannocystis sp.]|jgi:hypothetical protein